MTLNREHLVSGLVLAATALFLLAVAPGFPYRRAARIVAVAVYGAIFAGVAGWVVLWALGVNF